MSEKFDADFTDADIKNLLDALDDWEGKELEMLHFIEKLKHIPDPPEEAPEEFREAFKEFREHMLSQRGRLEKEREMRREKAIYLKTKVLIMHQNKGIDKLFNDDGQAGNLRKGEHKGAK